MYFHKTFDLIKSLDGEISFHREMESEQKKLIKSNIIQKERLNESLSLQKKNKKLSSLNKSLNDLLIFKATGSGMKDNLYGGKTHNKTNRDERN